MTASYDFAIVGGEVLLPDGSIHPLNIGTSGSAITALTADGIQAAEVLDASGLTIVPGIIDEHFHVFRGYGWETYAGATRSAAKGGITTVVDMPLDKPATLTAQLLDVALVGDRRELLLEELSGQRCRLVERHLDDRGDAALSG